MKSSLLADDRDDDDPFPVDDESVFQANKPASDAIPAGERQFGRYLLLRRLAYGGMGEIFLARQGGAGSLSTVAKLVVIKRILGHVKRDDKYRRMFLDEARLQALLNNQHVVQIFDMGEEQGHVYLAMEHVHGPSLRAVVDRCRKNREHIPLAHVATMLAQAARGLSYAHNLVDVTGNPLKIVHRDINPHNILVTYDGEVKIIDFGIAKSELADGHTETGTIKGKFCYMSPEQSAALPLDARSDVFTLGICLYELATLENPFRRGNVVLSLEAIQKDTPLPMARKRRDAAALQAVVDRCLAKDRNDRFDDAGDFAVALEALLASGVINAAPTPLGTWLRERFTDEIAEHLHVLEQTGSTNAVVKRGKSASSLPQRRPVPTRSSEEPTRTQTAAPEQPKLNVDLDLADMLDAPAAADAFTQEAPAPLSSQPASAPAFVRSAVADMTEATPSAFDVKSIADDVEPQRRSRVPVLLAAVVIGLGAAAGAFAVLEPEAAAASMVRARALVDGKGDARRVVEPVLYVVKEPPPPPPRADPPKDAPAEPSNGEAKVEAKGDAPVEPSERAPKDPVAKEPTKQQPTHPKATPVPNVKTALATLFVTSEGYAVKGGRKVFAGEPTTLTIDKADGAPFTVRLRVRIDDSGTASVDVDTDPWAIVRVDGVGRGKSPQKGLALPSGRPAQIELTSPTAGKMTVSLRANYLLSSRPN